MNLKLKLEINEGLYVGAFDLYHQHHEGGHDGYFSSEWHTVDEVLSAELHALWHKMQDISYQHDE